jgi:TatD DNase family protein
VEQQIKEAMNSNSKIRAWGEMGLDYFYTKSPPDLQRKVFERQLKCAVEMKKPMVIHTREAEEETFQLMINSIQLSIM